MCQMSLSYQEKYWSLIKETKGHAIYLSKYLSDAEQKDNRLNMYTAIASSSSIAGWAIWHDIGFVWAVIIAGSQLLNAIRPYLPYGKQMKELEELCKSYDRVSLSTEKDWYKVAEGELCDEEIHDLIHDFKFKKQELYEQALRESRIPHKKNLHKEAEQIAIEYFKIHY